MEQQPCFLGHNIICDLHLVPPANMIVQLYHYINGQMDGISANLKGTAS